MMPSPLLLSGSAVLYDLADRPVRLETLWADQPAVLVFLRHYG